MHNEGDPIETQLGTSGCVEEPEYNYKNNVNSQHVPAREVSVGLDFEVLDEEDWTIRPDKQ